MKEFIDKLIGKLEERRNKFALQQCIDYAEGLTDGYEGSIRIVNQLAEEFATDINVGTKVSEMPTGWITDRVPTKEECGNYGKEFLTTIPQGDEYKTVAMRYEYTTVRGKEVSRWTKYGRIAPWEPIAWMPLPAPYTEGEAELYRTKSVDGEYQEYKGDWK